MNIFVIIESDTLTFAAVTTSAACLLVITFEALRNIVVDDETDVWLVDAHTESDGSNDDVNFFHQESVLVIAAGLCVETSVIRESAYAVSYEYFSEFFNFLTAQAIDNT